MNRTTVSLLVAGLFVPAAGALAQMQVSGSVSADVLSTDVKTEKNPFRFDEYRDLGSGAALGLDIRGDAPDYYIRFFGENIGRDDRLLEFSGGKYGVLKYSIYNNNIIHNLTHDAISPFSGIGSKALTFTGAPPPSTNTATWNKFDYEIKHENFGGTFEFQSAANSPFYIRATANQKKTEGIKPIGNPGTSPGGPAFELPTYINFTTTDASAEAGYATKAAQFSVNLSWSRFRSHDDFLIWRNPSITNAVNTEQTTIAADNNLWKLGANAVWKQLPMGSTLALRGTYARLSNDVPIATTAIAVSGTTGQRVNTNPNSPTFNGQINNKTFSASLTSHPARSLDSRLYWNWAKKDNQSTAIVFRPVNTVTGAAAQTCDLNVLTGLSSGPTCSTELFHYRKNNLGVDLQYRVNPQHRVAGGWDYTDTRRERIDYEHTRDNKLYVEYKNNSLEDLAAKVKFQHLRRRSDFLLGGLVLPPGPPPAANQTPLNNVAFEKFLKRFDLADNDQNLVKLSLESTPRPFLDLGGEVILKKNDYKNVTLGRNNDSRHEYYLNAGFGDPKAFRISGFFDYEVIKYDSTHWVGNISITPPFPTPVGATNYLWKGKVKDKNYVLGIGADWAATGRLMFKGSYTWQKTDGTVDMASNTALAPLLNIDAYDSFKRNTLNLRGIYSVSKDFDLTLGWAYEKYKYSDIQMDGYRYTLGAGTGTSYFSGAYAFPNFNAHIVYATLKYNIR